jgi:hypothetical protein
VVLVLVLVLVVTQAAVASTATTLVTTIIPTTVTTVITTTTTICITEDNGISRETIMMTGDCWLVVGWLLFTVTLVVCNVVVVVVNTS